MPASSFHCAVFGDFGADVSSALYRPRSAAPPPPPRRDFNKDKGEMRAESEGVDSGGGGRAKSIVTREGFREVVDQKMMEMEAAAAAR